MGLPARSFKALWSFFCSTTFALKLLFFFVMLPSSRAEQNLSTNPKWNHAPRGEAVLIVKDNTGLVSKRIEGIRTVKVSPQGKIVVIHRDGVAALAPELVPENFLRGWNISIDEIRKKQQESQIVRASRTTIRSARLPYLFPWIWIPAPGFYFNENNPKRLAFDFHTLPWTQEDAKVMESFSQSITAFQLQDPSVQPWWALNDQERHYVRLSTEKVLLWDSGSDERIPAKHFSRLQEQQSEGWIQEALPRVEDFEVWRDVWSEFPLVEITDLLEKPEQFRDRTVRVRGRIGNINWKKGLEFFDLSDGVRNFRVMFTSLLQAAATERVLEERLQQLRSLPSDFSRDVTAVGEIGVEQGGRVFLDLIDFTF